MPAAKKSNPTKAKAKPAVPAKKPAPRAPAKKAAAPKAAAPKAAAPAPLERPGAVEMSGKPATVIGAEVKVGQASPHFKAQVGSWQGLEIGRAHV